MKALALLILLALTCQVLGLQYVQSLPNLCAYYNGTTSFCPMNPIIYCGKGKYYPSTRCMAASTTCLNEGILGGCAICGSCAIGADTCGIGACGSNALCLGVCNGLGIGSAYCVSPGGFGATCYCNAMCISGACNVTSSKCINKFKSAPNLCGFYNGTSSSCSAAINNFCPNNYYYPTQVCSSTPTNTNCIVSTNTSSCAICGYCNSGGTGDNCGTAPCGTSNKYGCSNICTGQGKGATYCVNASAEGGGCNCTGMCATGLTCHNNTCRAIPGNLTWIYPPGDNQNLTGNPNCRMNYTFTLTNATADYCYGFANPLGGGIIPIFPTFAPDSNTSCSFNALQGGYNYTFGVMDSNGLSNNTTTINFTCNIAQPNMAWIAPATDNQSIYGDTYNFKFSATPTWNDTSKNITNCGLYLTNSTDFYVLDGDYDNDTFICNVTASTEPQEDVIITGFAYNDYTGNATPTWNFTFMQGCANITTPNKIFNLFSNLAANGTCINVWADNVTVDCRGYNITSNFLDMDYGVIFSNSTNTTVQNCLIYNGGAAISYQYANGGLIYNTTQINCFDYCTYYLFSGNTTIANNTFDANADNAIRFYGSSNNTIIGNTIYGSDIGIMLNVHSDNNNITNNTVTWYDTLSTYGIYLYLSSNNVILGNNLIGNDLRGVTIFNSNNNTILNNIITNIFNDYYVAIYLYGSLNNIVLGNNITSEVWIDNNGETNVFNNSRSGNIYYAMNGTPSWEMFNIIDTNGDYWADIGLGIPFNATTVGAYWNGLGADYHPFTLYRRIITNVNITHAYIDVYNISRHTVEGTNIAYLFTPMPSTPYYPLKDFTGVTLLLIGIYSTSLFLGRITTNSAQA